jgi:hypothetical protein
MIDRKRIVVSAWKPHVIVADLKQAGPEALPAKPREMCEEIVS